MYLELLDWNLDTISCFQLRKKHSCVWGILFLGGIDHWNSHTREPLCQSVVTIWLLDIQPCVFLKVCWLVIKIFHPFYQWIGTLKINVQSWNFLNAYLVIHIQFCLHQKLIIALIIVYCLPGLCFNIHHKIGKKKFFHTEEYS